MCSSVGLGLTLLPTLHTSYMACRGSGVRVSLAPLRSQTPSHDGESDFRFESDWLMRIYHAICAEEPMLAVARSCM